MADVTDDDDELFDDPEAAPFPFVTSASSGPAPVIYSVAQSKVVVYKPEKTTTTTTTTTTATTTISETTTTTARPFHYQLPPSPESPPAVVPGGQEGLQVQGGQARVGAKKPPRPLLFTKRRPDQIRVSKPFEYLSKLSQFLSDRVRTGRPRAGVGTRRFAQNRGRGQLITRRTQEAADS